MDKYKKIFWGIVSFGLALLTIKVVFAQSGTMSMSQLLIVTAKSNKWMLFIAMFCSFLFIFFEGIAIVSILSNAGYERSLYDGMVYAASDIYFSSITPSASGGQPASAYFMVNDGIPAGVVTATLILNLMMYTLSIIVLGLIAFLLKPSAFISFSTISKIFIIVGFIVFLALSLVFLTLLKKGEWLFGFVTKIINFLSRKNIIHNPDKFNLKIKKIMSDYEKCAEMISGKKRILIQAFIWNFLQRLSQILVSMFVYIGMFRNVDNALEVYVKQCLITIGFNYVPVPGAMGIADYLMIDGFSGIMKKADAFKLEMVSRGMSFYICVLLGAVITLIGYLVKRRKNVRSI